MKTLPRVMRIGLQSLLFLCAIARFTPAIAEPVAEEQWRALARADLDFVHKTIVAAHPGAIDQENPSFRVWMEDGYRQAQTLLPRVTDYSTALDAVRWYVTGFRDGHLTLSDDTRPAGELIQSKGWGVRYRGGKYVVASAATNWPAPLPPIGAMILSCDGRSPETIAERGRCPVCRSARPAV